MRELKFRVWGLYGDEYTYIDEENQAEAESFWDKGCIAILDEKHIVECGTDEDGEGEGYEYCDVKEVETIEQYTGLKDKNGKEIYEGDIVEVCAMKMGGQILYDDVEYFAYLIVGFIADEPLKIHLGNFEWHKLEIIGNIHENPELLSESKAA